MTRRLGVFSYSKSITGTLLWAQKGWEGPATIGRKDPRKQRLTRRLGVFSYSKSITGTLLWAQKGWEGPAPMTRSLGVFSYSKSITETLLWAQKGWEGLATDSLIRSIRLLEEYYWHTTVGAEGLGGSSTYRYQRPSETKI